MKIQNDGKALGRKGGMGALMLAAAIFVTGCSTPASYGGYYDTGPRYSDRYQDESYRSYPSYSGSVYFGGAWHNGDFHYRDHRGGR